MSGARASAPVHVALVGEALPVRECAVAEVQPNDVDEQARDTVSKGWSKDQWISGVLERAIGIVARSAEKGQQQFSLTPCASDSFRYSVSDDKELSTFYAERAQLSSKHLGMYFPVKNIDVKNTDVGINGGNAIHIQGTQRPDSISLMKLTAGDVSQRVCICFEGDGHNIDAKKVDGGMYLYEKMFQDASLCHDLNAKVPAIFITSALFSHEDAKFPAFQDWSEQFLKEHVLLVEQLLQYIADKKTSSIHRALTDMDAELAKTHEFDFFCWINAISDSPVAVESNAQECVEWMVANTQYHYKEILDVRSLRQKFYSQREVEFTDKGDGLLQTRFQARVIKRSVGSIPVVIFAVPRLRTGDARALAADKAHGCSGMWYPMHVHEYVDGWKAAGAPMQNFLVPEDAPAALLFGSLSGLRHTDRTKPFTAAEFQRDVLKDFSGQFTFTLPWLWMNIAFLCKLKSSLRYKVAPKTVSTLRAYTAFTRKYSTQISSRDTVQNAMDIFAAKSTSLFSHVCRQRNSEVALDPDLASFLEQKCGWTNPLSASSPAVFFKLVGATNLITAHTLAKQVQRNAALGGKFEKVKDAFPLGAQVEIDYAIECLCRHYYFVQDKSPLGGFVSQAEFDGMQRRLRAQIRAGRVPDGVAEEEEDEDAEDAGDGQQDDDVQQDDAVQDDADQNGASDEDEGENDDEQKDEGGYKVQWGFQVREKPAQQEFTQQFLRNKLVAVKIPVFDDRETIDYWYRGVIDKVTTSHIFVKYNDGERKRETLNISNYGCNRKWVILEKLGN